MRYMSRGVAARDLSVPMAAPRFLADEMVGRLARYLRFQGCDTRYAKGMADDEIVRIAEAEDRVVLTRDRALAAHARRSLLLTSTALKDQWVAVARAFPDLPREVTFTRCTVCNGPLAREEPHRAEPEGAGVPWSRIHAGLPLYRCPDCGHRYWEGSHTARVRDVLRAWAGELDR